MNRSLLKDIQLLFLCASCLPTVNLDRIEKPRSKLRGMRSPFWFIDWHAVGTGLKNKSMAT